MLILKHLKTLQHVSIIIQIIFKKLVCSLLKSLNLKKLVENEKVKCGDAAASPHLTFSFSTSFLNSVTLTRNIRAS